MGQKVKQLKRIKVENQECLYERGDCKVHLAPLTYETISIMSRRQMAELHGVINNLKSHLILSDSFNNSSVTPNEIQLNSFSLFSCWGNWKFQNLELTRLS